MEGTHADREGAAGARGLRLMVYDATCLGRPLAGANHGVMRRAPWLRAPGLSSSWRCGDVLYRALGRIDGSVAAQAWPEALRWLGTHAAPRAIEEIQFWGHGRWGRALIDGVSLDTGALGDDHEWAPLLDAIASRMAGPRARFWLRTCESFGGTTGHAFATALSQRLGCEVAGHTYIIGPWQSGLHRLRPGETPGWAADEGLVEGTADAPGRAAWSTPWAPNTISCLRGSIPAEF